jgi:hypothetical protein
VSTLFFEGDNLSASSVKNAIRNLSIDDSRKKVMKGEGTTSLKQQK